MKGVDVSVWNDDVDWKLLKENGVEFAIVRCSYGRNYADENFLQNVNGAHAAGMLVGAYHYSTALTPEQATQEATIVKDIINNAGVLLEMPVLFDMEDADGHKAKNGFDFSRENITNICSAWLEAIKPLHSGIYASYSWLDNYIDWKSLGCPVWNAQWSSHDDLQGYLWQFTDSLEIGGKNFDGDIMYDVKHLAGLNPWEA